MSPSGVTIRPVVGEGDDLDVARDLFRAYAENLAETVAESLRSQRFDAEVAGLPGRYAPPSGRLLVALGDGVSVGCVALRDLGGGTCEMKRLYVAPEGRGRGVGRLLVAEVLGEAGSAGYRRMVLDTLPEMLAAIALYRSFGFVEVAPYWENPVARGVYMGRDLAD